MPHWINQPWQRNLSKTASDKPGAVQCLCHRIHTNGTTGASAIFDNNRLAKRLA
jgi:hypothetical protein